MNVPFYDLKKETLLLEKILNSAFKEILQSGWFIMGKNMECFEKEWASYLGVKYAYGVGSGTDALIIALKALGVKEGDEVIVPAFTFVATGFAVSLVGAKPIFVDVDPLTHAINPSLIEKSITKRTKVIIPVHLYGNPADMKSILLIAKKYKLFVIEDAAQAHGSLYADKKIGTFGDISCFSFYPAKNLGALGDGGAIVTNNSKLAKQVELFRNYGQSKKYYSKIVANNSRLDEMQAAFLRVKLKHLDNDNKKRRKVVRMYLQKLEKMRVEFPKETKNAVSCYHLFTIQIGNRDEVMKKLKEKGVEALIHYPIPIHLQEAYNSLGYKKGDLPVSERIAQRTLSLPLFPSMSKKQIEFVVECLEKVL